MSLKIASKCDKMRIRFNICRNNVVTSSSSTIRLFKFIILQLLICCCVVNGFSIPPIVSFSNFFLRRQQTTKTIWFGAPSSLTCCAKNMPFKLPKQVKVPHHRCTSPMMLQEYNEYDTTADTSRNTRNAIILDMLFRMIHYFAFMVDPKLNRFYYRCLPERGDGGGQRIHNAHCPIRDLGSAWDAATLVDFFKNRTTSRSCSSAPRETAKSPQDNQQTIQRLSKAIQQTICTYTTEVLDLSVLSGENVKYSQRQQEQFWFSNISSDAGDNDTSCAIIPTRLLQEPSNIAHSAFLILTTIQALRSSIINGGKHFTATKTTTTKPSNEISNTMGDTLETIPPIDRLARGILAMQSPSNGGAFGITFGDYADIYRGIEFYPGEALLALMEAYTFSSSLSYTTIDNKQQQQQQQHRMLLSEATRNAILPAVSKAFLFYSNYYRNGNVGEDYTSFFGNWQVQCFGKLFSELLLLEQDKQPPSLVAKKRTSNNNKVTIAVSRKAIVPIGITEATKDESKIASKRTTTAKAISGQVEQQQPKQEKGRKVTALMVADYIFELCDAITMSPSWHDQLLLGHYEQLATVEIACGLEALAECIHIASTLLEHDDKQANHSSDNKNNKQKMSYYCQTKIDSYMKYIDAAIHFLQKIQQATSLPSSSAAVEGYNPNGGLGHAIHVTEQRLDVTGHAANALIKVYSVMNHQNNNIYGLQKHHRFHHHHQDGPKT